MEYVQIGKYLSNSYLRIFIFHFLLYSGSHSQARSGTCYGVQNLGLRNETQNENK